MEYENVDELFEKRKGKTKEKTIESNTKQYKMKSELTTQFQLKFVLISLGSLLNHNVCWEAELSEMVVTSQNISANNSGVNNNQDPTTIQYVTMIPWIVFMLQHPPTITRGVGLRQRRERLVIKVSSYSSHFSTLLCCYLINTLKELIALVLLLLA